MTWASECYAPGQTRCHVDAKVNFSLSQVREAPHVTSHHGFPGQHPTSKQRVSRSQFVAFCRNNVTGHAKAGSLPAASRNARFHPLENNRRACTPTGPIDIAWQETNPDACFAWKHLARRNSARLTGQLPQIFPGQWRVYRFGRL